MSAHGDSIANTAAKLAPPVTVGGITLAGIPLSDVVLILTGIYAVLQIGFLLYDRFLKPRKEKRNGRK